MVRNDKKNIVFSDMTRHDAKEIAEEFLIDIYRERLFNMSFNEILDECEMKGFDYEKVFNQTLDTEASL